WPVGHAAGLDGEWRPAAAAPRPADRARDARPDPGRERRVPGRESGRADRRGPRHRPRDRVRARQPGGGGAHPLAALPGQQAAVGDDVRLLKDALHVFNARFELQRVDTREDRRFGIASLAQWEKLKAIYTEQKL